MSERFVKCGYALIFERNANIVHVDPDLREPLEQRARLIDGTGLADKKDDLDDLPRFEVQRRLQRRAGVKTGPSSTGHRSIAG